MQSRVCITVENSPNFPECLDEAMEKCAHISYQPITNQNSCDVIPVFPYSHLNTAIDQRECAYYPNYFINGVKGLLVGVLFGVHC